MTDPNLYNHVEQPTLPSGAAHEELRGSLCELFGRPKGAAWSYLEMSELCLIVRRQDWREEWALVLGLYQRSRRRMVPHTVLRLLEQWTGVLDRARMPKERLSLKEIGEILRVLRDAVEQHPANPESVSNDGRATKEQRLEYRQMQDKIQSLQTQLAKEAIRQ